LICRNRMAKCTRVLAPEQTDERKAKAGCDS
jgi:hypothetical protein